MTKHFVQDLDLINNQNFIGHVPSARPFSSEDDAEIDAIVERVDRTLDELVSSKDIQAAHLFRKLRGQDLSRLKFILDAGASGDAELKDALDLIYEKAVEYVDHYLKSLTLDNVNAKASKKLKDKITFLQRNGYLEFTVPQTKEFASMCEQQLDACRKKYQGLDDWRGATSFDQKSREFRLVARFIEQEKIVEIISKYKGMEMELYYIALDYGHSRQKWFKNNHEINRIVPTNYYHFDADPDVSKMLIYLTDVKEGDGPFRFVGESNRLPRSAFLVAIYNAIDAHLSAKFNKSENLYGRGLFLYRKDLLMKFPTSFIGTTHFGDDLLPESKLSKYLVEKTVTFCRLKGGAILFDGFRGIHAGGNPVSGERLAIQVAFKQAPQRTAFEKLKRKAKRGIRSLLAMDGV